MEESNLQEQYALLEKEKNEDRKKTIIIIILCILIILVTLLGLYFAYSSTDNGCTLNCDTNHDNIPDLNIDINDDDMPDINIDTNGDGIPDLNIDYNGDRKAHFNIDTNGDGQPDTNLVNKDINGDNICDFNCDTDGDGYPDTNIDLDNTNSCDLNCHTNHDNKCDLNCDTNGDGKADTNIDKDGDGKCDLNCDTNGDGKCDLNCDTNGSGSCSLNCDTNSDGKCDLNCDTNKDGKCDLNCDTDNDGECDLNCDTDNDGTPDAGFDTNGDGKCDEKCLTPSRSNANLKSLTVENFVLSPTFDPNKTEYTVTVDNKTNYVQIDAEAVSATTKISGTGSIKLSGTSTRISVIAVAQDGTIKTYNVTINKNDNPSSVDNGNSSVDINTSGNSALVVSYTKDINVKNIIPGWHDTQKFDITNKSNRTIVYNINLIDVVNTFKSDDFKYSLVKDGRTLIKETPAVKSNNTIYQKLVIAPGETAKFELNYRFVDTGTNQNRDINVQYKSKVEIAIVTVK